MADLASGRFDSEVVSNRSWLTGIPFYAVTVQQNEMFNAFLLPKTFDHASNQGAVVLHHLVLERDSDQITFRECRVARGFQQALEVVNGINVGSCGTGKNHNHRNPEGKHDCHAGGT
jgi:hypothetical protein